MAGPDTPRSGDPSRTINALAIQQKEFRVSRLGGYKMRDVDEFLDELTEAVGAMQTELSNLRDRPAAPDPVLGMPDLDDVGRQADEIIARAREGAARITAEAHAAAAEAAIAMAPSGTDAVQIGRAHV